MNSIKSQVQSSSAVSPLSLGKMPKIELRNSRTMKSFRAVRQPNFPWWNLGLWKLALNQVSGAAYFRAVCPVYKLLSSNFILDFILSAGNTPVTQGLPHCCIQYIFYSCLDFQECNISSWEVSDCFQTFLMSCLLSTVGDFTLSHFDVGKGPRISLKSMTKWRKNFFLFFFNITSRKKILWEKKLQLQQKPRNSF